jgi:hypothetical protein
VSISTLDFSEFDVFDLIDCTPRRAAERFSVAVNFTKGVVSLSNRFQARPPFASNTDPSGRDESWRMSAR